VLGQSGTPEQPGRRPGKNLHAGAVIRPWYGTGAAGAVFSYTPQTVGQRLAVFGSGLPTAMSIINY